MKVNVQKVIKRIDEELQGYEVYVGFYTNKTLDNKIKNASKKAGVTKSRWMRVSLSEIADKFLRTK